MLHWICLERCDIRIRQKGWIWQRCRSPKIISYTEIQHIQNVLALTTHLRQICDKILLFFSSKNQIETPKKTYICLRIRVSRRVSILVLGSNLKKWNKNWNKFELWPDNFTPIFIPIFGGPKFSGINIRNWNCLRIFSKPQRSKSWNKNWQMFGLRTKIADWTPKTSRPFAKLPCISWWRSTEKVSSRRSSEDYVMFGALWSPLHS